MLRKLSATLTAPPDYLLIKGGISRELSSLVGEGGFGTVFRGRYRDDDVAIKVLRLDQQGANRLQGLRVRVSYMFDEQNALNQVSQCFERHLSGDNYITLLSCPSMEYS